MDSMGPTTALQHSFASVTRHRFTLCHSKRPVTATFKRLKPSWQTEQEKNTASRPKVIISDIITTTIQDWTRASAKSTGRSSGVFFFSACFTSRNESARGTIYCTLYIRLSCLLWIVFGTYVFGCLSVVYSRPLFILMTRPPNSSLSAYAKSAPAMARSFYDE